MNNLGSSIIRKVILAVALGAALGLAAWAAEPTKVEERRLSMRLQGAEAGKVLSHFATMLNARLDVQCAESRPVTIAFENLTVETALSAICESAGLRWRLEEAPERILSVTCDPVPAEPEEGRPMVKAQVERRVEEGADPSTKVSLDLKDAESGDVMRTAADLLEARLLMDASLKGKTVTCHLESETVEKMLDVLCAQIGARWTLTPGTPPTLSIEKR